MFYALAAGRIDCAFEQSPAYRDCYMDTTTNAAAILSRLAKNSPEKALTPVAKIVSENRGALRRAIRRGHSLKAISEELKVPARTLQRHLSLAGLFFRKPRTKTGKAIRPYKRKKKSRK